MSIKNTAFSISKISKLQVSAGLLIPNLNIRFFSLSILPADKIILKYKKARNDNFYEKEVHYFSANFFTGMFLKSVNRENEMTGMSFIPVLKRFKS